LVYTDIGEVYMNMGGIIFPSSSLGETNMKKRVAKKSPAKKTSVKKAPAKKAVKKTVAPVKVSASDAPKARKSPREGYAIKFVEGAVAPKEGSLGRQHWDVAKKHRTVTDYLAQFAQGKPRQTANLWLGNWRRSGLVEVVKD
jgi:hypothetical protein